LPYETCYAPVSGKDLPARSGALAKAAAEMVRRANPSRRYQGEPKPLPKDRSDGMKLACHYQSLPDSGKFENRAALARDLAVSYAWVTKVLGQIQ